MSRIILVFGLMLLFLSGCKKALNARMDSFLFLNSDVKENPTFVSIFF